MYKSIAHCYHGNHAFQAWYSCLDMVSMVLVYALSTTLLMGVLYDIYLNLQPRKISPNASLSRVVCVWHIWKYSPIIKQFTCTFMGHMIITNLVISCYGLISVAHIFLSLLLWWWCLWCLGRCSLMNWRGSCCQLYNENWVKCIEK